MPTPLTYQKVQGASGLILVPIYNVGDLADSSFRVMTSKGLGAYELVALSPTLPIRVMTPTGPKSINTVVGGVTPNPNLLLYSEDFSQTAWLKGGSTTAIANNMAMPIGTGTYLSQMKTVEIGKTYTFTVWVQANAGDYSDFDIWAGRTDAFTINYGSKVCTPTDTLTAHSFTFTATTTTCYVGFDNVNGQTSPNILAKAKLEEGTTFTSYIKTP